MSQLQHQPDPCWLTAQQLGGLLETQPSRIQPVDCRSFLHYNAGRITGSVNVFCPPLVKKRFSKSLLPLSAMLSAETKATLCRANVDVVVVYDEGSDEESRRSTSGGDLKLVLDSMVAFLQPFGRPLAFYLLLGKGCFGNLFIYLSIYLPIH